MKEERKTKIGEELDKFFVVDIPVLSIIQPLFKALKKRQPGSMCLSAAQFIKKALPESDGLVLISTGLPMGGGVPETDGPVGAALLARALVLSFGVRVVILSEDSSLSCIEGAFKGAGLHTIRLEERTPEKITYLRPVYIKSMDLDNEACHRQCETILNAWRPDLVIAVERASKNRRGLYQGLSGRDISNWVSDIEYLFARCCEKGVPTMGVADSGNELGMGMLRDELPDFVPQTPEALNHGGIIPVQSVDYLVAGSVSNWGCSAIVAGLGLLLERMDVLHAPEHEIKSLEKCAEYGAIDGCHFFADPSSDGVTADEWAGLWRAIRGMIHRGLEDSKNWVEG